MDQPSAPNDVEAGAFASLLHPVSPRAFADEYWGRRPVVLRAGAGGAARRLPLPFTLATYREALGRPGAAPALHVNAIDDGGEPFRARVDARLAGVLARAGMSIDVTNVVELVPEFGPWLGGLAAQSGGPLLPGLTAFHAAVGGGVGLHFDSFAALSVQCDGEKRWWYSPSPAFDAPSASLGATHDARRAAAFAREHPWSALHVPDDAELVEVTLAPGDALYVPAGTWHRTESITESLSLTVSFAPRGFGPLLGRALQRTAARAAWRAAPPLSPRPPGAPAARPPEALRAYVAQRLDEARAALAGLTADQALFELFGDEAAADAAAPELETAPGRRDALALNPRRPGLVVTEGRGAGRRVFLHHDGARIEFPAEVEPFLRSLLERRRFVAEEALGWFGDARVDWAELAELLAMLVANGALVRG